MKRLIPLILTLGMIFGCQEELITTGSDELTITNDESAASAASSLKLTVMTRNMYIGANVDKVLEEPDPPQIPFRVAEAWQTLQETDFPSRARAMAREIADANPHLVGLQEVTLIRTQEPADFQLNAVEVEFDFLGSLMTELTNLGLEYNIVGQVENSDVEMPRFDPAIGLADVRITDYDVVLARSDVDVANVVTGNYQASFNVHGFPIKRGYVILDATVRGQVFKFVNTHPEPASTGGGVLQDFQVQELIAILESDPRPTILVGDMNTPAPHSPIYGYFMAAGYTDVWTSLGSKHDNGLTCCHVPELDNATEEFHERIDLILVNHVDQLIPASGKLIGQIDIVGKYPDGKTDTGLWPSDHAGVAATLQFPRPQ